MATTGQPSSERNTLPITSNEKIEGDITTIGSIMFAQNGFLGKGALSTVFRGQCDKRKEVAIKRIHYRTEEERLLIENEVDNLLKVEDYDVKVIRYFTTQRTANFYYIAMELALGTVEDYVERKQGVHTKPGMDELDNLDAISILRDSSKALEWLHEKSIVHRDIKPSNLMLVKSKKDEIVTKLADFGISKEMTATKIQMTAGIGTLDWMAPEAHTGGYQKGTEKTADVFSLGCVFHFIIFPGQHPFGDMSDRMANIQQGKPCLANIKDPKSVSVATRHLIEEMIQIDPTERPSSTYVVNHPALWTTEKTKEFFQDVSDSIKAGKELGSALEKAVNEDLPLAFVEERYKLKDWKNAVDTTLDKKGAFKSYPETTAGLLRLIRNKVHHFDEIPEKGQEKVGNDTNGMVNYITGAIPTLLLHVWLAVASISSNLNNLSRFYTESRPPKKLVPREHEEDTETQVLLERDKVHELQDRLNQALIDQERAENDLKMYEKQLMETRNKKAEIAEMEINCETKLEELRATISSTETKLRETEARNEDLNSKTSDLEQTNASLKKRLHEMERTLDHEQSSSKDKDEVIKRQLEEMQQQKEKQQALMNTKVALDAEISAFNKLLESKNTSIKKLCFPPGLSEKSLTNILQNSEGMEELTVTAPSDSTGQWVRLLPPSLGRLDVFGPGKTGEPETLGRRPDHGLVVVIEQADNDVINQLAKELGPRVTKLTMFNCPCVTTGALQRLLSALTGLEDVTLDCSLSGAITDASLAALHGCSQLSRLQLGRASGLCAYIPVTAVSRLVVTCRRLELLLLFTTDELSQTVLDALVQADLGKSDDGTPRTLRFRVLEPAYEKLRQRSTSSIKVLKLI